MICDRYTKRYNRHIEYIYVNGAGNHLPVRVRKFVFLPLKMYHPTLRHDLPYSQAAY